jgi:uncharacterized membrane-anchored protein YitT (DUF2179 family)
MSANQNKIQWKEIVRPKNLLFNLAGVFLITFALNGFMIPNKFLDGGITGISILLHEITHLPFSIFIFALNIPFLFLGRKLLGPTFAVQTLITIVLISILISVLKIPPVTSDKLLIAMIGGCIIGIGMGLCIRGGSAADGAEILAVLTTRNIGLNVSEVIFGFNTLIFLAAAWSFGISTALYSIITYFAATRSLDYVAEGIEQYTSLHIISAKSETIKDIIVNKFGKGITIIKGERGYLPGNFHESSDCDIVVTVVTRLELLRIKQAIREEDPEAFMYIQYIKEASGGVLSKKKHH